MFTIKSMIGWFIEPLDMHFESTEEDNHTFF